jgi:hypothetical protein
MTINDQNAGTIVAKMYYPVSVSCTIMLEMQGVRGTMNLAATTTLENGLVKVLGPIGDESRPRLEALKANVIVDSRPVTVTTYRRNLRSSPRNLQSSFYVNNALTLLRAICRSDECDNQIFEDFVKGEFPDFSDELVTYLRLNGPNQGTNYFNNLRSVTVNGTTLVQYYPTSEADLRLNNEDPRKDGREVPWWLWAALAVDAGLLVFIVWSALTLRISAVEKERERLARREDIRRAQKQANFMTTEQKQAAIDAKMREGFVKGGMDIVETSRKRDVKEEKHKEEKEQKKKAVQEMVKETKEEMKKKKKSKKKSKEVVERTASQEFSVQLGLPPSDERSLSTVGDRLQI